MERTDRNVEGQTTDSVLLTLRFADDALAIHLASERFDISPIVILFCCDLSLVSYRYLL
jgi:hypothetical protein